MKLKTIILTKDEAVHLERCIHSVRDISSEIWVVDSHSIDNTQIIARDNGAKVIEREWNGHSEQFNFAIDNITTKNEWVLRIDADEIIDPKTKNEIWHLSEKHLSAYNAISVVRSIVFNGEILRGDPYFKVPMVRIFRSGYGRYEDRLMDEHLLIDGKIYYSKLHILDECLKGSTFFKEKHKRYAKLEALYFKQDENIFSTEYCTKKRKQNRRLYYKFPIIMRPFLLYFYFLIIKMGFRHGRNYNIFLVKQVFLYRIWVDIEILRLKYNG